MSQSPGALPNLPYPSRCRNHPEREGVGICVNCRTVICVECSTRIDRMNYCIRCLRAAAEPARPDRPESPRAARLLQIPALLLSLALTAGIFFALGVLLAALRAAAPGGVTAGG